MQRFLIPLLLTAWCTACNPGPDQTERAAAIAAGLGPWRPLAGFYAALAGLQTGRRDRVAVLQIGDSHTANDAFSGRMRELMQDRFGNAGRGLMPAGIPYRYYRPNQVHVTADGFMPRRSGNETGGPFGLAGLLQEATSPATMTLEAEPPGLQRVFVQALTQPGGGTLDTTTGDGGTVAVSTAGGGSGLLRVAVATTPATALVQVAARGDGPVALLSWTAERAGPGVTWSNLGTIGATADLVQHWNPALMQAEAATLQPALIVLAFGTNEGFKDSTDLNAYTGTVRAAIGALRRAAPGAAIIVAGPPGGVRAAGRTLPDDVCPGVGKRRWAPPPKLNPVRQIERATAAAEGAYFWDWAATMGGDCGMAAWAETDPPMAARDRVHLLMPGARQTAESLFATLMQGYDRYRSLAGLR